MFSLKEPSLQCIPECGISTSSWKRSFQRARTATENITSENSQRPLESGELFAASPKQDCNRWANGRCISLDSLALSHKALTSAI